MHVAGNRRAQWSAATYIPPPDPPTLVDTRQHLPIPTKHHFQDGSRTSVECAQPPASAHIPEPYSPTVAGRCQNPTSATKHKARDVTYMTRQRRA